MRKRTVTINIVPPLGHTGRVCFKLTGELLRLAHGIDVVVGLIRLTNSSKELWRAHERLTGLGFASGDFATKGECIKEVKYRLKRFGADKIRELIVKSDKLNAPVYIKSKVYSVKIFTPKEHHETIKSNS